MGSGELTGILIIGVARPVVDLAPEGSGMRKKGIMNVRPMLARIAVRLKAGAGTGLRKSW